MGNNVPKIREMNHTQEERSDKLDNPIICKDDSAWLGEGYYFWYDKEDAHYWGKEFKYATGAYEIYVGKILWKDILDTVFTEQHYLHWKRTIEKFANKYKKDTNRRPGIKQLNKAIRKSGVWDVFKGILFQDIPTKERKLLVKKFYHRKRIQLALFDLNLLEKFYFLEKKETDNDRLK